MVARWEVFSSTTSEMGGRQSRQNGAARRNFALVVLAGACVLLLAGSQISGPGRSRVELLSEGLDERQMAKNMRLKKQVATRRVSSMHLVADIKKVLLDVETNLQRRRIRRSGGGDRKLVERPESPDVKKNLQDVDHIMDGLEDLVRKNPVESTSSSMDDQKSTVHHYDRGRLSRSLSRGSQSKPPTKIVKQDAKQRAIAAKMSALQAQIQNDFKKVTGYGKQAGYVPPPKIPHV